ncbi:MAG: dienelactone hydrolase family protein [Chloroflexi bacterium CFX2]|nr:dienelactone hydrolase family protein [Chloroflexi bacterium CFX2]
MSTIQLRVNDRSVNAYLASPSNGGQGVLVLPSWWGLKPFFKEICDQLAEHGYTALAPDYYDGRVAKTIDEAKELQGSTEGTNPELIGDIVRAAKEHLVSLAKNKIGVIGFSMGTWWSLVMAESDPNISAIVLFYGTGDVDFSTVKAKVLGHYAETDEWESLDNVRGMEQAMKNAGIDVTLHIYPKTAHWFMESDRPEYDPAAAKLAWERTFEFLKASL